MQQDNSLQSALFEDPNYKSTEEAFIAKFNYLSEQTNIQSLIVQIKQEWQAYSSLYYSPKLYHKWFWQRLSYSNYFEDKSRQQRLQNINDYFEFFFAASKNLESLPVNIKTLEQIFEYKNSFLLAIYFKTSIQLYSLTYIEKGEFVPNENFTALVTYIKEIAAKIEQEQAEKKFAHKSLFRHTIFLEKLLTVFTHANLAEDNESRALHLEIFNFFSQEYLQVNLNKTEQVDELNQQLDDAIALVYFKFFIKKFELLNNELQKKSTETTFYAAKKDIITKLTNLLDLIGSLALTDEQNNLFLKESEGYYNILKITDNNQLNLALQKKITLMKRRQDKKLFLADNIKIFYIKKFLYYSIAVLCLLLAVGLISLVGAAVAGFSVGITIGIPPLALLVIFGIVSFALLGAISCGFPKLNAWLKLDKTQKVRRLKQTFIEQTDFLQNIECQKAYEALLLACQGLNADLAKFLRSNASESSKPSNTASQAKDKEKIGENDSVNHPSDIFKANSIISPQPQDQQTGDSSGSSSFDASPNETVKSFRENLDKKPRIKSSLASSMQSFLNTVKTNVSWSIGYFTNETTYTGK